MLRPHHTPARFRTPIAVACCAVLGAGLLVGAGTATATPAKPRPTTTAAGSKVVGWELSGDTPDGELIRAIN